MKTRPTTDAEHAETAARMGRVMEGSPPRTWVMQICERCEAPIHTMHASLAHRDGYLPRHELCGSCDPEGWRREWLQDMLLERAGSINALVYGAQSDVDRRRAYRKVQGLLRVMERLGWDGGAASEAE